MLADGAMGLAGVVAQDRRGPQALATRLGDRLAHLQRHDERELVRARRDRLERAPQDLPALARRGRDLRASARAPPAASSLAIAAPMPRLAPVTALVLAVTSAVLESGLALVDEGGHAFFLVREREGGVGVEALEAAGAAGAAEDCIANS